MAFFLADLVTKPGRFLIGFDFDGVAQLLPQVHEFRLHVGIARGMRRNLAHMPRRPVNALQERFSASKREDG